MKELLQHLKEDNREQQIASIPKKTEYALMGVIKPKKGHTVWEFNLDTHECKAATYKTKNVMFSRFKTLQPIKELVVKEGYIYIPALNKQNAISKYNISKRQSDYYQKEPPFKFSEHFI